MASGEGSRKRPHVKTERMQEFLNMKYHKDPEQSPQKLLRCPEMGCDKVLTSSPGLRYHMKTHYPELYNFTCEKCHKSFKSANGLRYHTEKTKCFGISASSPAVSNLGALFGVDPYGQSDDDQQEVCEEDHAVYEDDVAVSGDAVGSSPASPDTESDSEHRPNLLEQLAIIATGPQSPLINKNRAALQKHSSTTPLTSPIFQDRAIHSYAKPPRSRSPTPPPRARQKLRKFEAGSESDGEGHVTSSSPFPAGMDAQRWPRALWQCFIAGTRVRYTSGTHTQTKWQQVEEVAHLESLSQQASQKHRQSRYAPNGLRVISITPEMVFPSRPTDSVGGDVTNVKFEERGGLDVVLRGEMSEMREHGSPRVRVLMRPDVTGQADLEAECAPAHPFFVKGKGWCSCSPKLTADDYGIPCNRLEADDVCLSPNHPDASFSLDVYKSLKSFDMSPADSTAVLLLSNMAKQRYQQLSPRNRGSPGSPRKKTETPSKAKRPMNAFMLFAKRFRMEYMQKFPGKDNRAISVMLGDRWKKLKAEERRSYATEAKLLADKHKKLNPDCWKRKRTTCVGSVVSS